MNQLSFGVKIEGASQTKNDLQVIADLQRKINEQGTKGKFGISSIPPSVVARSPDLLKELLLRSGTTSLGGGGGRLPPIIPPPIIPGAGTGGNRFNFAQLAAGAVLGPFHPFSAARGISTGLGLGVGGAVPVLAALTAVTVGLTAAFVELKRAVNEGAELYQHAARLGLEVGKTAQLESLNRTIGLNKNELDTLALQGSHIRHTGRSQGFFQQNDIGLLLGGAGTGQLGALQQVKNMSDYVTRTFVMTASAVHAIADDAHAMQEIKFGLGVVGTQLQAVFSDLITLAFPVLKRMLEDIVALLTFSGNILHAAVQAAQAAGFVPKANGPGTSRIQAGRSGGASISPWERMGFVIGGFGTADFARKTAENTAEIAKHTKGMNEKLQGLVPFNRGPGNPADPNHFYLGHKITPMP